MKKISVLIAKQHHTSISLEDIFYKKLKELAAQRHQTLNDLITQIDAERTETNLSSAIRIFVLEQVLQTKISKTND